MPKIAPGIAFDTSSAMLGTNWMKSAPQIAPLTVAMPPTTMPMRKVIESRAGKLSGATNDTTIAESAPPMPA